VNVAGVGKSNSRIGRFSVDGIPTGCTSEFKGEDKSFFYGICLDA
jgi:hypothetical protein